MVCTRGVDVGEGKGVEVRRGVGVEVMVGVGVGAMVGVTGVLVKALSGKVSWPDGTQAVGDNNQDINNPNFIIPFLILRMIP